MKPSVLPLVLLVALGLVADGSRGGGAPIRVGVYENEPLVFSGSEGQPQGIYIDLLEHIASKEGWELTYVAGSFEECLDRLDRGEIDLQTSIAWSEERAERYEFSRETVLANWGQVYARKGSGIESVLDLRNRMVAVIAGDIYEREFKQLVAQFGVRCRLLVVGDYTEVFAAVAEGDADAGVTNRLHTRQLGRHGRLERTPILFAPVELRFAAPKGRRAELLATLDRHLAVLKREDGSAYHRAIGRWLGGVSGWRFPPWLTWVLVAAGALLAVLAAGSAVLGAMVRARTAELRESNRELQGRIAEQGRAERALHKAEQERAVVLDTVSELVTYQDTDLRVIWANRAAAEMAGVEPEAMVGHRCHEIWHHTDRPCEPCPVRRAMETGQPQETEGTTPDGRVLVLRAYPVQDDKGQVVGTVEVALEVTERKRVEQQLVDSEREKALILGSVSELVSFQDRELRIRWANRAAAESVGLALDDLIGRHCHAVWNQREAPCEGCPVQKVLETGEPQQGEMTTPDGRVWDVRGYPARDDKGRVIGAVEVTQEITERKKAEEGLRQEVDFRTTLIEASPAFFVAIDAEGKTLMMNESMLVALGYRREEVDGRDYLATFVPERERERIARLFRRLTELRAPTLNENHLVAKNGRELLVEWHGRPVLQADGTVDYFFGVGMDVTERRRAEQELRESEEKYRMLVEMFPHTIAIFQDNQVAFANPATARMYGVQSLGEIIGRDISIGVAPGEKERLAGYVRARAEGRSDVPDHYHATLVRKDGEEFPAEVFVKPITYRGRPATQVLAIDITERKQAERELERHRERLEELVEARTAALREVNAELEAFAYSVSHDLRAPLRAMEGFADALLEDYGERLDEEGRDHARSIGDAARRMDALIQDLLAYSRIGRAEIELGPTSLDEVVEATLVQLETPLAAKQAQVSVAGPLPHVVGHHATLAQAVANLLSNAIKFVAPGVRPQVRVWAEPREGRVRLWVEDNGIGMAAGHADRIFEVFERLHGPNAYPGTGVGLAIVRRGIERMGGRVGMDSEPGKGSRFWVELAAARDVE